MMVGFVSALRSFQSGSLSREELFADVDLIIREGTANKSWLIERLDEENTNVPLPPDVHKKILAQIKYAEEIKGIINNDNGDSLSNHKHLARVKRQESSEDDNSKAGPEPSIRNKNVTPEKLHEVLNNRFVLEQCVGSGGMSTVYKALDRRKLEANDRSPYVAVKVLNIEFRSHPDSLMALQREAKKSQSLAHPNIVRVYDFDRDGSTVFMTMEYLQGVSLAKVLRAPGFSGLSQASAMPIIESMANALIFAHDNGIVHEDFKPANVILTDSGDVKIIDFGIACAFQRPDETDMEATLFDPGSLGALTPTYASPEMLEHQAPDPRDDIYALACITYEMLTGHHPFGRLQANHARDSKLSPARDQRLTRRQWKAIKSALAFDYHERTPEVRQFLKRIRSSNAISIPIPKLRSNVIAGMAFLAFSLSVITYYYTKLENAAPPSALLSTNEADFAALEHFSNPSLPLFNQAQAILTALPCAALTTTVKDGVLNVQGFVSHRLPTIQIERKLLTLPGVKKVNTQIESLDVSKCAIIELYAPYLSNNKYQKYTVSIQLKDNLRKLKKGDHLIVNIKTPAYESFVNMDYFTLDGGVVHMLPGPLATNNQAPANHSATFGKYGEWIIGKPFGKEMVLVLVTPQPLFNSMRDEIESQTDYLAAVNKQLVRISKKSGPEKIVAQIVLLNTVPK